MMGYHCKSGCKLEPVFDYYCMDSKELVVAQSEESHPK